MYLKLPISAFLVRCTYAALEIAAMAVTQSSDGNSKQPVGVKHSCGEGAVYNTHGSIRPKKSDGPSNGIRDVNKGSYKIAKSSKHRKNQRKVNEQDSLSDIDDVEVSRYLNSKQETRYKTMLWEAINWDYKKPKKHKRAPASKKAVSAKVPAKTSEKGEMRQKQSSRINYEALKLLTGELAEDSEKAQACRSPKGTISHGIHQSRESSYDEDEPIYDEFEYGNFGYHDNEMDNEYTDGHFEDEYNDF